MKHKETPNGLLITIDKSEQAQLFELGESIHQDVTMFDFFEGLIANSELQWIDPKDTGDLTSAPMLGILGTDEHAPRDYSTDQIHTGFIFTGQSGKAVRVARILKRWAFMDYQVLSVLEVLRDHGAVVFEGGKI